MSPPSCDGGCSHRTADRQATGPPPAQTDSPRCSDGNANSAARRCVGHPTGRGGRKTYPAPRTVSQRPRTRDGPGGAPMKNVEMRVDGNILTIKVDLTKEFGPSSSGKTTIVASTEGNVDVLGSDVKV